MMAQDANVGELLRLIPNHDSNAGDIEVLQDHPVSSQAQSADDTNFSTQALKCQFCGVNMLGLFNLNKHLSKVHKAKISIDCKLCGANFRKNKEFVKHLRQHQSLGNHVPPEPDFDWNQKRKKSERKEGKKSKKKSKHRSRSYSDEEKSHRNTNNQSNNGSQSISSTPQTPGTIVIVKEEGHPKAKVSAAPATTSKIWDWTNSLGLIENTEERIQEPGDDDWWAEWDADIVPPSRLMESTMVVPESSNSSPFEQVSANSSNPGQVLVNKLSAETTSQKKTSFTSTKKAQPVSLPDGRFSCSMCEVILKSSEFARIHADSHKLKVEASFRCGICFRCYLSCDSYQLHWSLFHRKKKRTKSDDGVPRLYGCTQCKYRAKTSSALNSHITLVHSAKKFPCKECGKVLSAPNSLKRHMEAVHGKQLVDGVVIKVEPPDTDPEDVGGEDTATSGTIIAVNRITYPCEICGKELQHEKSIKRHMQACHDIPDFLLPPPTGPKKTSFEDTMHKEGSDAGVGEDNQVQPVEELIPKILEIPDLNMEEKGLLLRTVRQKTNGNSSVLRSRVMATNSRLGTSNSGQYACEHCDKVFRTHIRLVEHMTVHSDERPYCCEHCGKTFKLPRSLRRHIRECHSTKKDRIAVKRPVIEGGPQCPKCFKFFPTQRTLKRHLKCTHLKPEEKQQRKKQCPKCHKWLSPNSFYLHVKIHEGTVKDILCPHCGKGFAKVGVYRKHLFQFHRDSNPPSETTCVDCGREFKSKELLDDHREKIHAREQPRICEICGKYIKNQFNRHMERHLDKTIKCEICGKMWKTKVDLQIHSRIHGTKKQLTCRFCDYRATQWIGISEHIVDVHFGPEGFKANAEENKDNTFKCTQCDAAWPNQACLDFHVKYHYYSRDVPCDSCSETFHTKYDMKYHKKIVHPPLSETTFACTMCDRIFKTKGDLKYHMATHTGEYKFTCEICGKRTISRSNMTAHMRTHLKVFKCRYCTFSATSQAELKNHNCDEVLANLPVMGEEGMEGIDEVSSSYSEDQYIPNVSSIAQTATSSAESWLPHAAI